MERRLRVGKYMSLDPTTNMRDAICIALMRHGFAYGVSEQGYADGDEWEPLLDEAVRYQETSRNFDRITL